MTSKGTRLAWAGKLAVRALASSTKFLCCLITSASKSLTVRRVADSLAVLSWQPRSGQSQKYHLTEQATQKLLIAATLRTSLLFLSAFLIVYSTVSASSKLVLPRIDESDLLYHSYKQKLQDEQNLYLFSTIFMINSSSSHINYSISAFSNKNFVPIITLPIYLRQDLHLTFEFFDSTIWGQLGRYFNQTLELIIIENEIISLFQKLEMINKKYREIFNSEPSLKYQIELPVTLKKEHFFHSDNIDATKKSDHYSENSSESQHNQMSGLRTVISNYENRSQKERLKTDMGAKKARPEGFASSYYSASTGRTTQSTRNLDTANSEMDSPFVRFFKYIVATFRYFQENKFEFLLYLSLIIILSNLVKVWYGK